MAAHRRHRLWLSFESSNGTPTHDTYPQNIHSVMHENHRKRSRDHPPPPQTSHTNHGTWSPRTPNKRGIQHDMRHDRAHLIGKMLPRLERHRDCPLHAPTKPVALSKSEGRIPTLDAAVVGLELRHDVRREFIRHQFRNILLEHNTACIGCEAESDVCAEAPEKSTSTIYYLLLLRRKLSPLLLFLYCNRIYAG